MLELTPKEIVAELDKYIIGQYKAKRMVAIALRNRYRRNLLPEDIREEIVPKNILMMGPTGVGKTEIARRLAKLVKAPFIKVEATKFTEVGYVGRDVESIVRDLVEASIHMVKEERMAGVSNTAKQAAEERLVELLMPKDQKQKEKTPASFPFALFAPQNSGSAPEKTETAEEASMRESTRGAIRMQLKNGLLEDQMVEIEVEDKPNAGADMSAMGIDLNMNDMLGGILPKKMKIRKVTVSEARRILEQEEADKLIDRDDVNGEALKRAERDGIVFIDEIDKIAGRQSGGNPDVSREGVQRDILPIVEGSTVNTKYGPVKTDHMLFIAAGAFHIAKVEDLIPELQGRFPIRVELDSLTAEDFQKILKDTENAQTKQYAALLATEGVRVVYTDDGIKAIADFAFEANENSENLGARRLHGIMEELFEDVSFDAEKYVGELKIDGQFVEQRLLHQFDVAALKRFVL
ncbi:MAG: ATP-dependent protease ATPase subunit HslU [Clostridia bacterium]|nr:ATP-dependent protease ATPase subunit HslU [Clostridia bacterium]